MVEAERPFMTLVNIKVRDDDGLVQGVEQGTGLWIYFNILYPWTETVL